MSTKRSFEVVRTIASSVSSSVNLPTIRTRLNDSMSVAKLASEDYWTQEELELLCVPAKRHRHSSETVYKVPESSGRKLLCPPPRELDEYVACEPIEGRMSGGYSARTLAWLNGLPALADALPRAPGRPSSSASTNSRSGSARTPNTDPNRIERVHSFVFVFVQVQVECFWCLRTIADFLEIRDPSESRAHADFLAVRRLLRLRDLRGHFLHLREGGTRTYSSASGCMWAWDMEARVWHGGSCGTWRLVCDMRLVRGSDRWPPACAWACRTPCTRTSPAGTPWEAAACVESRSDSRAAGATSTSTSTYCNRILIH